MALSLPARPSLESLHKQAKQLLRDFVRSDPRARERVLAHHPRPQAFSGLRDAQLALAREYGFAGWSELREAVELRRVEALSAAERAGEFADLACLTYSDLDDPRRIARATRLLERHPGLVEQSLFAAAAAGDVGAVERALTRDPARVRERGGPRGWSPLLYLAYSRVPDALPSRSALATARALLARGADPNDHFIMNDAYRFTVLTGAIGEGEQGLERQPPHAHARELAVLLLDAGADPDDAQGLYNSHFTPSNDWLELLLARGLTAQHPVNWSPSGEAGSMRTLDYLLCTAVGRGFEARVELLLCHGADANAINPYDHRPIHRNALREGFAAIAERLRAAGARTEELTPEDELHVAMRLGDLGALARLGRAHPQLARNPQLLGAAVLAGNTEVVRALLELGADPRVPERWGVTALHRASHHGRLEVAELLLERGAPLDARDDHHDSTPVGWADHFGQHALRDQLLARTTDVFDLAAWARVEQLEAVLRANPSVARARRGGACTALHGLGVAGERGAAAIDLLLRAGAELDAQTAAGRTPLDVCVLLDRDDVAELLLERGAKSGTPDAE